MSIQGQNQSRVHGRLYSKVLDRWSDGSQDDATMKFHAKLFNAFQTYYTGTRSD